MTGLNEKAPVRGWFKSRVKPKLLHYACGATLFILGISSLSGCESPFQNTMTTEPITTTLYFPRNHINASMAGLSTEERIVIEDVMEDLKKGRTSEAIESIEAARKNMALDQGDPFSMELIYLKGVAIAGEQEILYRNKQRTEEAIALFGKMIKAAPNDSRAYFHRWQLRLAAGDREGAAEDREAGKRLGNPVFDVDYSPLGGVI